MLKVEVLLECVLLSDLCRPSENLREVILRSVRLALGAECALVQKFADPQTFKLPSKSEICRFRLRLDAALARTVAAYWTSALASGDFALCMLADSSPRGGKDWLLSEVYMVRHSDMAALAEAQDEIAELRKQLKELAEIFVGRRQGLKDRIRTLSARQQGKIWHHVLPPSCARSGRSELE